MIKYPIGRVKTVYALLRNKNMWGREMSKLSNRSNVDKVSATASNRYSVQRLAIRRNDSRFFLPLSPPHQHSSEKSKLQEHDRWTIFQIDWIFFFSLKKFVVGLAIIQNSISSFIFVEFAQNEIRLFFFAQKFLYRHVN